MKILTCEEMYKKIFDAEKEFAMFKGLTEDQANRHANLSAVTNTRKQWRRQFEVKAKKEELYDNIDRPNRHNVAGPLNRPSDMQLAAYNKSKGYK